MSDCGAIHPENGAACHIPATRAHRTHSAQTRENGAVRTHPWPNEDYIGGSAPQGRQAQTEWLNGAVAATHAANPPSGFPAGLAASEASANARWDEAQKQRVREAIQAVAHRHTHFTSQQVWEHLDGAVPVTKGMTAMLQAAARASLIEATTDTSIRTGGGQHDHGQRLTVWRSLLRTDA